MRITVRIAIVLALPPALARCAPSHQPETSAQTAPATTVSVPDPKPENAPEEPSAAADGGARRAAVELPSGVRIEDLRTGDGKSAEPNSRVSLHYVGTLTDGTVFDSSRKRNQPFEVQLGQGALIKGFEEGLVGMRVGGIRRIVIPPELGYGDQARANIPAHSTLVFEIELLN